MARALKVGEKAPDPAVLDAGGEEVRLSGFWHERPAILAFLRHFG
jgi:peroxiredoxin